MFLKDKYSMLEHIYFESHSMLVEVGIQKELWHRLNPSNNFLVDFSFQLLYSNLHSIKFLEDKYLNN